MNLYEYSKPFSFKSKLDTGVLVIHGFTSTPQSVEYYCNKLHEFGFNVEAPVLKGHAVEWKEMNNLSYRDWIEDVEKSYKKLKKRTKNIFVSGLSMGGTLALKIAELCKEIKGIILINHALFLKRDPRLPFIPIIMNFMASDKTKVGGDLKDANAYELTYDRIPLKGLYEFIKLMRDVKKNHSKIHQPVIIFKSIKDHVIPAKSAYYTMKNISSKKKELIWLNNSYHVAIMDYDKDFIIEKSIDFINTNIN